MTAPRRGEFWTGAGGGYASRPRPVLVLQDDHFSEMDSITVALVTSHDAGSPLFRVAVPPKVGLREASFVMVDKIMTVRRTGLRDRIGVAPPATLIEVERALLTFLGLAG